MKKKNRGTVEAFRAGEEFFRKKRGLKKRDSRFAKVRFDRVDDFGAAPEYQIDARVDP